MFYVFTAANADFGGKKINSIIKNWTKKNYRNSAFVENFGGDYYLNLMNLCKCMIGNSSSGIVESGYFKKPVINILPRQKGRDKNINVIDVSNNTQAISKAVNKAISKKFKKKCEKMKDIFKVMESYKISNYVYSRIKALKFI